MVDPFVMMAGFAFAQGAGQEAGKQVFGILGYVGERAGAALDQYVFGYNPKTGRYGESDSPDLLGTGLPGDPNLWFQYYFLHPDAVPEEFWLADALITNGRAYPLVHLCAAGIDYMQIGWSPIDGKPVCAKLTPCPKGTYLDRYTISGNDVFKICKRLPGYAEPTRPPPPPPPIPQDTSPISPESKPEPEPKPEPKPKPAPSDSFDPELYKRLFGDPAPLSDPSMKILDLLIQENPRIFWEPSSPANPCPLGYTPFFRHDGKMFCIHTHEINERGVLQAVPERISVLNFLITLGGFQLSDPLKRQYPVGQNLVQKKIV